MFTNISKLFSEGFNGLIDGIVNLFNSLFDFFIDLFKGLFEFLKPLIDACAWLLDFLGGLIAGIGNFIWNLFKGALDGIVSGIFTIVKWVGDFFGLLAKLFESLFVPTSNFFNDSIDVLKSKLDTKIDTEELSNAMNSLKNVQSRSMSTPRAIFMGVNINIDIISTLKEHLSIIHMFVRGITFILLLRYNINNIYKLIRGSDLSSGGED